MLCHVQLGLAVLNKF